MSTVRNHKSVKLSVHAKQRFRDRLNINIDKYNSLPIDKMNAVACATYADNSDSNTINTSYLARVGKEDIVLIVKETRDGSMPATLATMMTDGHVVDAIWEKHQHRLAA